MPHHYTKGTVEASIWCNKCRKETPWRIADGRRQYCLTCYAKPAAEESSAPPPDLEVGQGDLFR